MIILNNNNIYSAFRFFSELLVLQNTQKNKVHLKKPEILSILKKIIIIIPFLGIVLL
jgi:hypothetical protein